MKSFPGAVQSVVVVVAIRKPTDIHVGVLTLMMCKGGNMKHTLKRSFCVLTAEPLCFGVPMLTPFE